MTMLIGYSITLAVLASFVSLLAFLIMGRKEILGFLRERMNKYSVVCLAAIIAFFIIFSLLKVSAAEQLYFDENIYQGIAINMLRHANALWCQYGSGYLGSCSINALYHDPVGWSSFIAIAFAIFGIGTSTAYNLQLLVGAMSIFAVFILASAISDRKEFAVIAAFIFIMMPQLYVWSRTQADFDLPFMMLATLAFFFFFLFERRRSFNTLATFSFSVALVVYMRIEAMLLVPLFALLLLVYGNNSFVENIKGNVRGVYSALTNNVKVIGLVIVFLVLLLPEVYYIATQFANPSYGQPQGQPILSLSNFISNSKENVPFLFGLLNGVSEYPLVFHGTVMALAIIGTGILAGIAILGALGRNFKRKGGLGLNKILVLWLWFFAYFLFYSFFYAGSVTYGVDSRFMLQILPPVSLLAAFAVFEFSELLTYLLVKNSKIANRRQVALYATVGVFVAAAIVYPFIGVVPIITLQPQQMPQQSVILRAINFFYDNYSTVPKDCLVFSFTPDIWYEVNRGSAQVSYLQGANSTLKDSFGNYSCKVFDYGYWCVVPPYHDSLCKAVLEKYSTRILATGSAGNGYNTTFYQLLNYS